MLHRPTCALICAIRSSRARIVFNCILSQEWHPLVLADLLVSQLTCTRALVKFKRDSLMVTIIMHVNFKCVISALNRMCGKGLFLLSIQYTIPSFLHKFVCGDKIWGRNYICSTSIWSYFLWRSRFIRLFGDLEQ